MYIYINYYIIFYIIIFIILYFYSIIQNGTPMKFIRHRIVVPESHSFQINKLNQKQNRDIIHSHKNYELNFVVSGSGRRFVGGNISMYGPGDLVLMGPDLPHCWEVDNHNDEPVSITIHFKEDLFDNKLFSIPEFSSLQKLLEKSKQGIFFKYIEVEKIEKYLEDLRHMHGFDSMLQILKILGHLMKVTEPQVISSINLNTQQHEGELEMINKIYDYVFRNFRSGIKLKEVAALANMSESTFSTFFKKRTNKTFSSFVKEIRIGFACKLLADSSDLNIAQICFDSGYNNIANFNRQFKEVAHMNPREYRMKYGTQIA